MVGGKPFGHRPGDYGELRRRQGQANQVTGACLRGSLRARASAGYSIGWTHLDLGAHDHLSPKGGRPGPPREFDTHPFSRTLLFTTMMVCLDGWGAVSETIPAMSMENVAALHLPQKFNPSHNPSCQILQLFQVKSIRRHDAL